MRVYWIEYREYEWQFNVPGSNDWSLLALRAEVGNGPTTRLTQWTFCARAPAKTKAENVADWQADHPVSGEVRQHGSARVAEAAEWRIIETCACWLRCWQR